PFSTRASSSLALGFANLFFTRYAWINLSVWASTLPVSSTLVKPGRSPLSTALLSNCWTILTSSGSLGAPPPPTSPFRAGTGMLGDLGLRGGGPRRGLRGANGPHAWSSIRGPVRVAAGWPGWVPLRPRFRAALRRTRPSARGETTGPHRCQTGASGRAVE